MNFQLIDESNENLIVIVIVLFERNDWMTRKKKQKQKQIPKSVWNAFSC